MAKTVFMDIEGKVSELALYKITDIFPFPDKYLTVNIGDEHKRWLYTAATRAIDKLIILKN